MIVKDLKRLALVLGLLAALMMLLRASLGLNVSTLFGKTRPGKQNNSETDGKPLRPHNETHTEIFSASTPTGGYFKVRFGEYAFNPNIIPHPSQNDTWIIMAQLWDHPSAHDAFSAEVGCNARFLGGALVCIDKVRVLPISPTHGAKCEGEIGFFRLNVGPHDARVFYGPRKPYTIYGSNSAFTCFGMWMRDFRKLVDWGFERSIPDDFEVGTELQRPEPYSPVEKNWFVFWDGDDRMHAHYNIYPKRAFARLGSDGSAGRDLAPVVAAHDERCMKRYLPKPPPRIESIHQATNALKVTLCDRADWLCKPDDSNTFILTIIQHKRFYNWHSEYEPYAVLFHQRAPYELYAISKKPLWISGRRRVSDTRTDMFYVTSANWRDRGVKYHGFLDDVLFLGFGIEDKEAGGIDVKAADLLVDLGLCPQL
ncbi:hypothetical protein MFIFM68171_10236 [Madurella fahalii]|uniref:Uncharacterized protein n=1 Tax=Madurella fahalii TaxID=1157608 RepID=A0ABQ0GQK2_9PEZI